MERTHMAQLLKNKVHRFLSVICVSIAILVLSITSISTAHSADLPKPSGKIILTITGDIANTNSPGKADFDYQMLQEIGLVTMTIETMWTIGGAEFEGILSKDLLEAVGAKGSTIRATAANDYSITIPAQDLLEHDTLLALSQDGARMRLRDKGPIWLLYNNEDHPKATESELNSRMIWQLTTLEIN